MRAETPAIGDRTMRQLLLLLLFLPSLAHANTFNYAVSNDHTHVWTGVSPSLDLLGVWSMSIDDAQPTRPQFSLDVLYDNGMELTVSGGIPNLYPSTITYFHPDTGAFAIDPGVPMDILLSWNGASGRGVNQSPLRSDGQTFSGAINAAIGNKLYEFNFGGDVTVTDPPSPAAEVPEPFTVALLGLAAPLIRRRVSSRPRTSGRPLLMLE